MSYGWPALSWSGDVRRQVGRDREQLIGLDWHRQMLIQRFKQLSQELLASSIQVSAEIKRDAAYSNCPDSHIQGEGEGRGVCEHRLLALLQQGIGNYLTDVVVGRSFGALVLCVNDA